MYIIGLFCLFIFVAMYLLRRLQRLLDALPLLLPPPLLLPQDLGAGPLRRLARAYGMTHCVSRQTNGLICLLVSSVDS